MKPAFIVALLACLNTGCVSRTPQWDARFGDATRAVFAQQILHPESASDSRPVTGIDGKAAVTAQQRYQKSFTEPPPPASVFTIGVSGSK